ncbi:MAG: FHA domain-containing protein [Verrucomicrobiota bacterium]
MAKLIFLGDKFGGRTYEIAAQRTTVGRSDTNTLTIHDNSVSEQHCEIYDNGADLIIRDLGSRNGTVVNGKLLRAAQAPLAHGETVTFGSVEARLEIPHRTAIGGTATDVTAVHLHAKKISNQPPASNPFTTLESGTAAPADHTMQLQRPESVALTTENPSPSPAPTRRSDHTWLYIVAAVGVAILLWLILR